MKKVYTVFLESESCDSYGPFLFDHELTKEEMSKLCHECDGDQDKDGPGFDGSYCYVVCANFVEVKTEV